MMAAAKVTPPAVWTLGALLEGWADAGAFTHVPVHGLALDSRHVQLGDLFLACSGRTANGHAFITDAVVRGAAAVVYETPVPQAELPQVGIPAIGIAGLGREVGPIAERFFGEPTSHFKVFGVTGTNGKTSTSHLLAQALSAGRATPCGLIGTLGNGMIGELDPATHTTPDAVSLHRVLARLRDGGATHVAMEVSSHALDQHRVSGVRFTTAIFTNLSRDHLDYHQSMEAYAAAKQKLFLAPGLANAVINMDDPVGRQFAAQVPPGVRTIGYAVDSVPSSASGKQLLGKVLRCDSNGCEVEVQSSWGPARFRSPLLGRFNVSNLLAVLAVLLNEGVPLTEAVRRLERVEALPGRMEAFRDKARGVTVVVDYAHTPDALEKVLTAIREHAPEHVWCVFGCGGNRDAGKRPLMGEIAARLADEVIVTDDNPRHEDPAAIVAQIIAGMPQGHRSQIIHDRRGAIGHAIAAAGRDDVVLVAGKGHEEYQAIAGRRLPFSDRAWVLRQLEIVR